MVGSRCSVEACSRTAVRTYPLERGDDGGPRPVCRSHYVWAVLSEKGGGIFVGVIGVVALVGLPSLLPGPDLLVAPIGFLVGVVLAIFAWTLFMHGVEGAIRRASRE